MSRRAYNDKTENSKIKQEQQIKSVERQKKVIPETTNNIQFQSMDYGIEDY